MNDTELARLQANPHITVLDDSGGLCGAVFYTQHSDEGLDCVLPPHGDEVDHRHVVETLREALDAKDSGARSYLVGLPVVVTVHPDGTVEVSVDLSEAGVEVRRYDPDPDDAAAWSDEERAAYDDRLEADADAVERRVERYGDVFVPTVDL